MANICEYKVIVKGKKNACYAFYGSMPAYNDKYVVEEEGTDENYTLRFNGDCKWAVDCYSKGWNGGFPVTLPQNPDDAMNEAQDKYWDYTVEDRSQMFNVEVLCNSADIEDYDREKGPDEVFVHYKNGHELFGKCPKELKIAEGYEKEPIEEVIAAFPIIRPIEGTAYEGRIERIENVKVGDTLILKADYYNRFYNPVAIEVFNIKNETLGYLKDGFEWESLWMIAKHIDKLEARVVSVTPLSQRRKGSKYALMDVELSVKGDTPDPVTKGTEDISTNNAKTKPVTQKKESGADKKIDDTRKTEKNAVSVTTKNEPNSVEKPKLDYVIENGIFVKYTGTAKKVIIPKEIKEIADNAFADCKNLQAVEFCDGLLKIGKGAFKNTGLTYVDIPASVQELNDAFDNTCVVAVNGEMPYYLSRISEIEKMRLQIDAKDKLISETMNRKQTLQKALDEYINAKPSEFSEIEKYQKQISEIEKERTDYSRKITEKNTALNNLIAQKRAEKAKLEEERKKCFFLAISKKKELDAQIQGKQHELKLLYDEKETIDEEFRTTDNNFKEKINETRGKLDGIAYMQNRWEADRNVQINTINRIETELQGYIEEITSLKVTLETAEAYERTHTEWLEKKEKALSEIASQKFEEGEITVFEITAEMLQAPIKTKATSIGSNAPKNDNKLEDEINELMKNLRK